MTILLTLFAASMELGTDLPAPREQPYIVSLSSTLSAINDIIDGDGIDLNIYR